MSTRPTKAIPSLSTSSSSTRPNHKARAPSSSSSTDKDNTTVFFSSSPDPLSPTSPLSPISSTSSSRMPSFLHPHSRSNSTGVDGGFFRSRSRSKSPRPALDMPESAALKHSKTTPISPSSSSMTRPAPKPHQSRHKSDGALPSMTVPRSGQTSPGASSPSRTDSFFQKKNKPGGTLPHYGRHGDQWLFGDISLTRTVKGLVRKGEEER